MTDGFKVFEPLAATLRLTAPPDAPHWENVLIAGSSLSRTAITGPPTTKPELRLWFDRTVTPGFQAFARKVKSWLQSLAIASSSEVVHLTIGALALRIRQGNSLTEAISALASFVRQADVSHFAVLQTNLPSSWTTPLEWKGFVLGPLDIAKVVRRSERAGDPLMIELVEELEGRPAVASPIYERAVFDLAAFLQSCAASDPDGNSRRILVEWFHAAHHHHWREMWADFDERRALIYALGYGLVEGDTFRKAPWQLQISCYLKLRDEPKNEGHMVWLQQQVQITLPDLGETKAAISAIREACPLDKIQESSLFGVINAYAMTLCRGTRISLEGHPNESYLQFIIALEQLFSTGENISQAIAERTAALVHRQIGKSFPECRRILLKDHYVARSRFVHSGVPVPPELFASIHDITQAVLRSLLWVATKTDSKATDFFERWVKRLDWIVVGYEAGIDPSEEILNANGIIGPAALLIP